MSRNIAREMTRSKSCIIYALSPRPPAVGADRARPPGHAIQISNWGGGDGIQTYQCARSRRNSPKVGERIAAGLLCGERLRDCLAFALGGDIAQREHEPLDISRGPYDEHAVHQ